MENTFIFLPLVIFFLVAFVGVPIFNIVKNVFGENTSVQKNSSEAKYSRQVHHMHVKDAADERRRRLDQLKSLYEAGMMERDEYLERCASVEAEYR